MPIDALGVLCVQLTRDLLAIAKFLFHNGMAILRPGRRMQGSMKKSRFSTTISLYQGNDTRWNNSYNRMGIGNRTQVFEC